MSDFDAALLGAEIATLFCAYCVTPLILGWLAYETVQRVKSWWERLTEDTQEEARLDSALTIKEVR